MKNSALPYLKFRKHKSGQSIVEIVLSIGVAALVVGALVVLGSVSLRTGLSSARRAEATRLAISGLEAMRFRRDNDGFDAVTAGCYTINAATGQVTRMTPVATEGDCPLEQHGWTQIDLTNSSSQSIFDRKIQVVNYGVGTEANHMRRVTVTVRWPEGAGGLVGGQTNQRSVVMSLVLSDWE